MFHRKSVYPSFTNKKLQPKRRFNYRNSANNRYPIQNPVLKNVEAELAFKAKK
jgi:hypothetical protein